MISFPFEHYSEAPWQPERWPNFSAEEFACNHCGEFLYAPRFFDAIQKVRDELGKPVYLSSAHRCSYWNKHVGGATRSQHLVIALDVKVKGHDRRKLLQALWNAGFRTFGFYGSFVHVDFRPGRRWSTKMGALRWGKIRNIV